MTAVHQQQLATFVRRAALLGVRVEQVEGSVAAADAVWHEASSAAVSGIKVSGEVWRRAPDLIVAIGERLTVDIDVDPVSLRNASFGLGLAHAAYAETGSVLLAEPDLADRAVGMLSGTLIVVLPADRLLGGLDEAVADLRAVASRPGGGYATIMTGPSRTADIERVLTVGVQGPGRVVVLLVDDLR